MTNLPLKSDGNTLTAAEWNALATFANGTLSVFDYGAIGDGVADDAAALNAAAAAAKAANKILVIPYGIYLANSIVIFDCDVQAHPQAVIRINNAAAYVQLGTVAVDTLSKVFRLPRIIQNNKVWAGAAISTDVGLKVLALTGCEIYIPRVTNFSIGALFQGDSVAGGCQQNRVFVGWLENNAINMRLSPNGAAAWVNQNTFYDGIYSHSSSEGMNVAGVKQVEIVNAANQPNGNVFLNPSLEGNVAQYGIDDDGGHQQYYGPRLEAANAVRFGSNSQRNLIVGGYDGFTTIVDNGLRNCVLRAGGVWGIAGSADGALLRLKNLTSSGFGGWAVYAADQNIQDDARWGARQTAIGFEAKAAADAGYRISLQSGSGQIRWAPGDGVPDVILDRVTPNRLDLAAGDGFRLRGGTTAERDAIVQEDGFIWYNTSTSKLQVRAGGVWADLH